MKKYEYVEVKIAGCFLGGGNKEYRKIIDEYAMKGYKYIGFIPVEQITEIITKVDLIFEIEA